MAEYNIGDKVILKDDGQFYTVVGGTNRGSYCAF
jgi:uncharacterized protein YodC (DUF2158 family)